MSHSSDDVHSPRRSARLRARLSLTPTPLDRLDPFPLLPTPPLTSHPSSSPQSNSLSPCPHKADPPDAKRQKMDPTSSSSRPPESKTSDTDSEDAVFLPCYTGDGTIAFLIRGTNITVDGEHLEDVDVGREQSQISLNVEDDGEEEEEEPQDEDEGEEGEEGEEDGDGEMLNAEELFKAVRQGLVPGLVAIEDEDEDDDEDYQPMAEDDEEEEDEEDEGEEVAVVEAVGPDRTAGDNRSLTEARALADVDPASRLSSNRRPPRWSGPWDPSTPPTNSPEHLDSLHMERTFAQQIRAQSLYTDRYPMNLYSNIRNRSAPTCIPPPSPLSSTYHRSAFLPTTSTSTTDLGARVFCGRFSSSGGVYCCASQDGRIHLYSTDPFRLFKRIDARDIGWSVIDVDFSHDERHVIYSSWSEDIQLVNVPSPSLSSSDFELHDPLHLHPNFDSCMFSIRWSPSDTEILAGLNRGVMILHDVDRQRNVFRAVGHSADINTVCFMDEAGSGNVFASGSDDSLIKLWDRRTQTCVGGWLGHLGGLTSIAACCNGQYLLSNSKDQSMKLWDVRRMNKRSDLLSATSIPSVEYRWRLLNRERFSRVDKDRSLCTYVGHSVQQTLIRCGFSPESAGRCYVYSGSSDGSVCIWNTLSGEMVSRLSGHRSICREVTWDPRGTGLLMSASWDHTVRRWEWIEDDMNPPTDT